MLCNYDGQVYKMYSYYYYDYNQNFIIIIIIVLYIYNNCILIDFCEIFWTYFFFFFFQINVKNCQYFRKSLILTNKLIGILKMPKLFLFYLKFDRHTYVDFCDRLQVENKKLNVNRQSKLFNSIFVNFCSEESKETYKCMIYIKKV